MKNCLSRTMHLRAKTRLGDRFGPVFAGLGDSKTSDSVRDILQNSTFSVNRFRDLIKTWSEPLLHRVDAPNKLHSRGGGSTNHGLRSKPCK